MDIKVELKAKQIRLQKLVEEANQLVDQRQSVMQEIFRVQGEIRILTRISKDGHKDTAEGVHQPPVD